MGTYFHHLAQRSGFDPAPAPPAEVREARPFGEQKQVQEVSSPALEENSVVVKEATPAAPQVRTEKSVFEHPAPSEESGEKKTSRPFPEAPNPPEEKAAFPLDHLVLQRPAVIEPIRAGERAAQAGPPTLHRKALTPEEPPPPERSSELQVEGPKNSQKEPQKPIQPSILAAIELPPPEPAPEVSMVRSPVAETPPPSVPDQGKSADLRPSFLPTVAVTRAAPAAPSLTPPPPASIDVHIGTVTVEIHQPQPAPAPSPSVSAPRSEPRRDPWPSFSPSRYYLRVE